MRRGSTSATLPVARQQVGDQRVAVDEPRQPALHAVEDGALGQALPLLAAPRLLGDQFGGACADASLGSSSRAGKMRTSVRSSVLR